jgi:hypothetical protein
MNERFEQMMLEATKDMPQGYYVPGEYFQKFAELIVRECMTICKEHPSRIVSNNWVADAVAPDIVREFEEHFGVEE